MSSMDIGNALMDDVKGTASFIVFGLPVFAFDVVSTKMQKKLPIHLNNGGKYRVRYRTFTNLWSVCIKHFTSISCKHPSNFD